MTNFNTPIILVSNINNLDKSKKQSANKDEISVAILPEHIHQDNPRLFPYRQGMSYFDDFKPNVPKGHKLPSELIEVYYTLLSEARVKLEEIRSKLIKPAKSVPDNSDELEKLRLELEAKKYEIEMLKSVQPKGKVKHYMFDKILLRLKKKQHVYLYGVAGTGKSELAKQLAEELGLDFHPCSTVTQEFKLTGYQDANGNYHATAFYNAIKNGGVFFIDEMDSCSSEVLVALNGALANGYFDFPHELVYAHKDFVVVSAGNTIGRGADMDYTGRFALDLSTIDRFWAIKIDYDIEIDKAVSNNDIQLVEFAHAIRKASERTGITLLMSYRSISRVAEFKNELPLTEIIDTAILKGMNSDDVNLIIRNMDLTTSNPYYKALKDVA